MVKVVNHVTTPAVESPTDPGTVEDECEALKKKYKLDVACHDDQEEAKSVDNQSHHILQDATVGDYISRGEGLCVLLADSHGGTPHRVTTSRQNKRMNNKKKPGGPKPATNFGELKKLSAEDLTESFKKMGAEDEEAKKLADCLVAEAEKELKKAAKRDKDLDVTDSSPVQLPNGCFPAAMQVWLDGRTRRRITKIDAVVAIEGRRETRRVVRRDWCVSPVVRLRVNASEVQLSPFHRVMTAFSGYRRADELNPGTMLLTHTGPAELIAVERDPRPRRIHSIGVGEDFECRIGRAGLWVELPNTGVEVSGTVHLGLFRPARKHLVAASSRAA